MNLPDAPVAREGFFVTHFFTLRNQEKSKDFYVRILGGKVREEDDTQHQSQNRSRGVSHRWHMVDESSVTSLS